MHATRFKKMFRTISASSRPKLDKPLSLTGAPIKGRKLGLEGLESRDRPTTISINHPGATGAYTPVNGPLFGANGPTYTDVQQGATGDCWLLSSLAEVAARVPSDIKSMFTYAGTATENGSTVSLYDVRLYNSAGVAQNVLVDTELPAGGNEYDHPANGVMWVALAEKAYAQANGARIVTSSNVGSDTYGVLNEGYASWALQAITGKAASNYSFNSNNIAAAWNAGEFVVIGTSQNPSNTDIVGGHDYAVVGYTASSSQTFKVYNPWGTNSAGWALGDYNNHEVYGLFTASASFLAQNFTGESFGTAPASGEFVYQNSAPQSANLGDTSGTTSAPAVTSTKPPVLDVLQAQPTKPATQSDPIQGTVASVTERTSSGDIGVWID